MKKIIISLLVALPLLLIGCGGGGSGSDDGDDDGSGGDSGDIYTPATSVSFSPITAVDSNGQPAKLYWKYSANGGKPINASLVDDSGQEISILVTFDPMLINIDIGGETRVMSGEGSLSSDIATQVFEGNVSFLNTDNFSASDLPTFIGRSRVLLKASIESQDILNRFSDTLFDDPTEWFLDNEYLDEFGLGVPSELEVSTATTTVTVAGQDLEVIEEVTSSWKILEIKDSAIVNNKTYTNVVLVEQTIQIEQKDPVKVTYWVAKGIGMIRGEDFLDALGTRVDIELLETNLVQVVEPGA